MKHLVLIAVLFACITCSSCTEDKSWEAGYQTGLNACAEKVDSLQNRLREQIVLIKLTELQCKRYAKIVQKNPSQSIFIVGWIDRAFEGTVPEPTKGATQ